MKLRHLFLAVSLAVSTWLVLFGDNAPESAAAEPVVRAIPAAAGNQEPSSRREPVSVILALLPRDALIGGATMKKNKERVFASQSWTPPPLPPAPPPPPSPPTAPPLPFTYLGKKIEDGQWEVFLSRDDQTLIVRAESTITGTYRIDAIKPPILTLTYLPLNQVQTFTIGGAE
jgi:hypothetical protein